MADNIGDLIDQTANLRTLAPAAVGTQVGLMSVVSAITILVFNILRPRNKIVYEPKVKYHVGNKQPPRISDSIFGWVSPLLHTKEPVLVEKIGLDAAVFLRFLRMMRWLFTCIAALACAVLIPINVTYNLQKVPKEGRDALSMLTIRDVQGNRLFVHVAVSYVITFLVMGFVWMNWRAVIILRRSWFRSPEYIQSFYARTLMLNDVPKKYQSDEGIRAIFNSVNAPYPTTSVHIGRSVGRLPELIEYHNDAVRELEQALVKYLKHGKIGKVRPTIRVGGFMCFGGEKKDAIDYYTAKLQRTERAVEEFRNQIDNRKAENYGFASMAAVPYAHIVANLLRNKRVKGANVSLAPNPKDIIWENLNKPKAEINGKKLTGWIFLVLVCFFNTVPLFIISILANLASITTYVPFLQAWSDASPETFTIVSGVLPPAVSALFGFFLPIVMRWLSQYQGATTHSRLDRAVIARYFAFLVISQLVIFTLIGVIFNSVKEIVSEIGKHKNIHEILDNIDKLPGIINRTYIDQASYWLTYFPLRGFLVLFDLAQIINLVWIFIKTHLFGRTPRDIREWTQPPEFQYAVYYSNILFMGTVGIVFSPLAPLVAVAAAVVLWVSSWVYKYQLMFVFVSQVETGGFGGTKMDARVVAGGIKIAGIEQSDLEYDPALYQRDRGELDWDTRSVSSANLLAMDNKSQFYASSTTLTGRASPAPAKAAYDRYLAQGPQPEIEMTRFDGDQQPLLTAQQVPGYFDPMNHSTASLPYSTAPSLGGLPEVPPMVPQVPAQYQQQYREAPVHRPYPSREISSSPGPYQGYSQYPAQRSSPERGSEVNMAGRGAYRGPRV
ncbi:unnamed protein product [Somion occarium]|uniref:DUF221-domain-containing protein n=1 Tax=Somion occarium TaxID=3059160 RepID=A0ABP1DW17_9APHY